MAVLETAAHVDDSGLPLNRYLVRIEVSDDLWFGRRTVDVSELPVAWAAIPAGRASVRVGTDWLRGMSTAILEVPSVIVPEESIALINPLHPGARTLTAGVVRSFEYNRLFCGV